MIDQFGQEHNLFKNVPTERLYLWQTQIQTTEYGLIDAHDTDLTERSFIDALLIYMPKEISVTKKLVSCVQYKLFLF